MFQANQAYEQFLFLTGNENSFFSNKSWLFGLMIALSVAVVIVGGIKSIGNVASKLVPFMAIIYVIGCCLIIIFTVVSSLAFKMWFANFIIPTSAFTFGTLAVISAYLHPCKSSIANISLAYHFMQIAAVNILITLWILDLNMNTTVLVYLFAVVVPMPHVMMFIWLCYQIEKKFHLLQRCLIVVLNVKH